MEILKGVFDEYKYDNEVMDMVKTKTYHIYLEKGVVKVLAPFPVKHLNALRQLLKGIRYTNIIIGDPEI